MTAGPTSCDVAIVGGGPAGLAAAIAAATHGLSAIVCERRTFPVDKTCGEGLLPPAVLALERLGVMPHLAERPTRRFAGVRFVQEDGASVDATLPGAGGLGVRRTVLATALAERALALGVSLRAECAVTQVERTREVATLQTTRGAVCAGIVVAADGLHSPLRRAVGLEGPPGARRRVAIRQHFALRPWSDRVEVHVDRLGEAVVTPVADDCVNVNWIWERGALQSPSIPTLLARFPVLRARLGDVPPASTPRGAGPMARYAVRRTTDRLALLGDAAGFVDSIAADGLAMAFNSALLLGAELPAALRRGGTRASLAGYERGAARLFRSYWLVTQGLLSVARRPRLRSTLVHFLAGHPTTCRAMMSGAMSLMLAGA